MFVDAAITVKPGYIVTFLVHGLSTHPIQRLWPRVEALTLQGKVNLSFPYSSFLPAEVRAALQ